MPQSFWIEEYRKKAALSDPIAQSGRGSQFQAVEFLYVVKQAIELLELRREHDVLDLGCANGLVDILLSACCHSVLAVEPVEELVVLARKHLVDCPNVRVDVGHGAAIPVPDDSFDRVLVLGVMQLVAPEEVPKFFCELRRVTRRGGRILFGSVPHAHRRDAFLNPYLEGVRQAAHLSEEQKAEIIARNLHAYWYDPAELAVWWSDLGGKAEMHPLPPSDPNASDRFHLVVSIPK